MGIFCRLFGGKTPGAQGTSGKGEEHAVLIFITLAAEMPSDEELKKCHSLQDHLAAALKSAKAGELDGDEWGDGRCTVYMYGPDAESLWRAIKPVLKKHSFPKGFHAIKRLGGPQCDNQERIDIASIG